MHLFPAASLTDTSDCTGGSGASNTWPAGDNSGLTLSANTANLHGTSAGSASIITSSGGTLGVPTVVTSAANPGTPCTPASAICDANGNYVGATVTTQGSTITTTFTDTTGNIALTAAVTSPQSTSSPNTYTYTGPSGPVAVKVNYGTFSVHTQFLCSGIVDTARGTQLPTSIGLPDGTSYSFTYEPTPGNSYTTTGRLASVTLPTGGTIQYTYTGGNNGIECSDGSAAGLTRELSGPGVTTGTWTYTRSGSAPSWTTTLLDPASNQTVIDFSEDSTGDYYETERTVQQGSGSTLAVIDTCYNTATTVPCVGSSVSPPITKRNVQTTLYGAAGNLARHAVTAYDSFGMPTEVDEYGYSNNLLRKTVTAYDVLNALAAGQNCKPNTAGYVCFERPSEVQVYNEAGGEVLNSQTQYGYSNTVTTTTGTPQHTTVSGDRGNLTTVTLCLNSSCTSKLNKTFAYYDTGNISQATDANGAVTAYTYAACGNSYLTSVSEPLNLSRSMSWDSGCAGGVQASVTDENSQTTNFYYTDPNYWRLTSTTDPGATTSISYCTASCPGAFGTESNLTFNNNSSTYDFRTTLDGLGRVHVSQRKNGPSVGTYDSVETDYDAEGRIDRVTMPYNGTAGETDSSAPATTTTYDGANRPLTITDGGGGTVSYSYNERDVLKTVGPAPSGENTKNWQYEYDGLGHLMEVCEITTTLGGYGTCSETNPQNGFYTTYGTDAIGDLTSTSQNAQTTSPQNRNYAYDLLGRMTSETNPESGTASYTYDTDATCGTSGGDLVKKVDAIGNVSCYSYDALHRVTGITYSGPNAGYPRYFVYDAATVDGVAMPNAKGRLARACTSGTGSCGGTLASDLGFGYSTRGEPTDTYTWNTYSGGWYHANEAYRSEYGLPYQLNLYANSGAQLIPTITYGADSEGRVNSVSAASGQNPVTNVTYGCETLISGVSYGSGDSDTFNCDTNTGRMTQYKFNVGSQAMTGNLTWNANGTLQQVAITDPFNSADTQTCTYGYDDLARLASDACAGGSTWNQSFSVGALGNLSQVANGGGATSFVPTWNPATNRVQSVGGQNFTYDADGNLLSTGIGVGTNTYTWNAYGRMLGDTPYGGSSISAQYDALGRMALNYTGSGCSGSTCTTFVYGPSGEKLALMNGQTLVYGRVGLPGGGLALYGSGMNLARYWHADWQGTMRLLTNSNQTFYHSAGYAPYGETYASSGNSFVPDFAGLLGDTSSELDDALYREYNSTEGRWMSPDPAGLAAVDLTNPQSLNRYAYVMNNPTTLIDPWGLGPQDNCTIANGCKEPPTGRAPCTIANGCRDPGMNINTSTDCALDGLAINCGVLFQVIGSGATNVNPATLYANGGTATFQVPGACTSATDSFGNSTGSSCDPASTVTITVDPDQQYMQAVFSQVANNTSALTTGRFWVGLAGVSTLGGATGAYVLGDAAAMVEASQSWMAAAETYGLPATTGLYWLSRWGITIGRATGVTALFKTLGWLEQQYDPTLHW
jgi:RHS repeat-associated protein